MIKKIAVVLLIIAAIVLGMAATKPDSFSIVRSASIKAPPEKIFALVNDFHNWQQWSPWEKLDPNMQRTFSGAPAGKGAVYSWKGNSDVGSGRMEILDASAPGKLSIQLDFIDPVATTNLTGFTFVPSGDSTTVTWNMQGPMPFLSKLITVFMDVDAMIAKDFDKGLAQLKAAAEK